MDSGIVIEIFFPERHRIRSISYSIGKHVAISSMDWHFYSADIEIALCWLTGFKYAEPKSKLLYNSEIKK